LLSGITLGATISGFGFGSGDKVDFDAVGYASTDRVAYASGIVSIDNSTGATVASFAVTGGTYSAANFKLSADPLDPSGGNLVVSYAATPIATAFDFPVSQSSTVPEPSTWVMMLLGFTGLGYAGMRRSYGLTRGRIGLAA
jgi:hypothetical protein